MRGKKLLALWTVLVLAAAGLLVSCRSTRAVTWTLPTQYYDVYENYIELPVLVVPEGADLPPGAEEANTLLDGLAAEYRSLLASLESLEAEPEGTDLLRHRCVLYPSETEQYLSLLFWRWDLDADLMDDTPGRFFSVVYDKEEDRVVTLEDALALAGEDAVFSGTLTPNAFRMDGEGKPVFYSSWKQEGSITSRGVSRRPGEDPVEWDPTLVDGPLPVPEEELSRWETPLWWEWFGTTERPVGEYADPLNAALPQAYQNFLDGVFAALEERYILDAFIQPARRELLAWVDGGGGTSLGAARITDRMATFLVLAAADDETGKLREPPIFCTCGDGTPNVATFQKDGADYLLYTHNSMSQGYTYGEAGLVRFDGADFSWVWPVEGDIREEASPAYKEYRAYWERRLALLCPGGVELFTENDEFLPGGTPVQWKPESSELFYQAPEDSLPIGMMWKARVWLEAYTQSEDFFDGAVYSAHWRIAGLTPVTTSAREQYVLTAEEDFGDGKYDFKALLTWDDKAGSFSGKRMD